MRTKIFQYFPEFLLNIWAGGNYVLEHSFRSYKFSAMLSDFRNYLGRPRRIDSLRRNSNQHTLQLSVYQLRAVKTGSWKKAK